CGDFALAAESIKALTAILSDFDWENTENGYCKSKAAEQSIKTLCKKFELCIVGLYHANIKHFTIN
nr:hypothetical protein [Bacteroidales bacterium]